MERKLNTRHQALSSTHPLYPPMTFHLFVYTRRPYAWPLNELINFLNFVNHVTRQNGIVFIYFRWPCRLYSNTQLYMFYIFPLVMTHDANGATRLYTCTISASPYPQKKKILHRLPLSYCLCLLFVFAWYTLVLEIGVVLFLQDPRSRSRRHNCVRIAEQWQDRHTPRWVSSQVRISAVTISTKSL